MLCDGLACGRRECRQDAVPVRAISNLARYGDVLNLHMPAGPHACSRSKLAAWKQGGRRSERTARDCRARSNRCSQHCPATGATAQVATSGDIFSFGAAEGPHALCRTKSECFCPFKTHQREAGELHGQSRATQHLLLARCAPTTQAVRCTARERLQRSLVMSTA